MIYLKKIQSWDLVVEAVHPILVDGQPSEDGWPAGAAAADRGEGSGEDSAPLSQPVQMWSFHHGISQCTYLYWNIININN